MGHTADVEFVASGGTPAMLFRNALLAMFDTAADTAAVCKGKGRTKTITVRDVAPDLGTLLWYVLQDALSVADAEGFFLYGVSGISFKRTDGGYKADATLLGKDKEPRYAKLDVKGVSRYDLKVWKVGRTYRASAVLDV